MKIKKRLKLVLNVLSLTITSFALAFGVFSATTRTVTVNGTISYVSNIALARISSSIVNGFQDDDLDKSLVDINPTRNVVVDNFDAGFNRTENFEVVSGNAGVFISENRWNIGSMYFNPSPNTVPSNQTPVGEQVSATIQIVFDIANYTTFPISVTITPLQDLINPLEDIATNVDVGYDLTEANIASIAASNVARSNVTTETAIIYLKINNLALDISQINFGFSLVIAKA